MCGFVRSRAAGPPAFAATAEAEKAQAYVEFQGTVEDALEAHPLAPATPLGLPATPSAPATP